jgi:hypothetical protein
MHSMIHDGGGLFLIICGAMIIIWAASFAISCGRK